jgi:thiosulfate dehydrogenase [quinone] large subunit
MSENREIKCHCAPSEAIAALLLRADLGLVLFFYGLNKFLGQGGLPASVEYIAGGFRETYLPMALVWPFAYVIPFAEVVLGLLLVLGLMTRAALLGAGLLLLALTTGQAILGDPEVVGHNLIYMILVAGALWFSSQDNRYSLDRVFKLH